jgi:hypothetical protein
MNNETKTNETAKPTPIRTRKAKPAKRTKRTAGRNKKRPSGRKGSKKSKRQEKGINWGKWARRAVVASAVVLAYFTGKAVGGQVA